MGQKREHPTARCPSCRRPVRIYRLRIIGGPTTPRGHCQRCGTYVCARGHATKHGEWANTTAGWTKVCPDPECAAELRARGEEVALERELGAKALRALARQAAETGKTPREVARLLPPLRAAFVRWCETRAPRDVREAVLEHRRPAREAAAARRAEEERAEAEERERARLARSAAAREAEERRRANVKELEDFVRGLEADPGA